MPAKSHQISLWIPQYLGPAGWASKLLSEVVTPDVRDVDQKAFGATLLSLAQDLDHLWPRAMGRWQQDPELLSDLAAALGRMAEAYERESNDPDGKWGRVARARAAAWRAAWQVLYEHSPALQAAVQEAAAASALVAVA